MDTVWNVLALSALFSCAVCGVLLTVVRLPGPWLLVAGAAIYGWWSGWPRVTLSLVAALAGVAVVAEVIETALTVFAVRRSGASGRAAWGGVIGGFLGMLVLAVPVPVLGVLIGAVLGCFAGAALAEWTVRDQFAHGTRVGIWSAIGFAAGAVVKLALAMLMAGATVTAALWGPLW